MAPLISPPPVQLVASVLAQVSVFEEPTEVLRAASATLNVGAGVGELEFAVGPELVSDAPPPPQPATKAPAERRAAAAARTDATFECRVCCLSGLPMRAPLQLMTMLALRRRLSELESPLYAVRHLLSLLPGGRVVWISWPCNADGDEARALRPLQAAAVTYRIAIDPCPGQTMLTHKGAMPREATAPQPWVPTLTASACTPPYGRKRTTAGG